MTDDLEFDPETGEVFDPPTAAPPLPQIVTMDDLRAHLWEVHRVTVDRNDPLMMIHTMHRAFLEDYWRMLKRHEGAITKALSSATEIHMAEVRESIAELRDKALSAGLENRLESIRIQVRLAEEANSKFRRLVKVLAVLTMVNVGAAFLALGVLTFVIR